MNNISFYPTEQQKITFLEGIELMCEFFWGPNPEQCRQMLQGIFFSTLEELAAMPDFPRPDAFNQFKSFIENYSDPNSLFDKLEEDYVRLFISDREGITAPMYQSCYEFENAPLMGASAIQMKHRLESKGLDLADHLQEPPDHLCIELEYLYFLMQTGWHDKNSAYIEEGADFASEIMLPWVDRFRQKIARQHSGSFYALAASVLCALLDLIARIHNQGSGITP